MGTLTGYAGFRNIKPEVPVVNLSTTVTILAGDSLAIDGTNTVAAQLGANPGAVGLPVTQCTAGSKAIGVAVESIPPGGQGVMQTTGFVTCAASADNAGVITAGDTVSNATAGQIKTSPGSVSNLGIAWTTTATQGDQVIVEITRTLV